jgi:hypothetical protein
MRLSSLDERVFSIQNGVAAGFCRPRLLTVPFLLLLITLRLPLAQPSEWGGSDGVVVLRDLLETAEQRSSPRHLLQAGSSLGSVLLVVPVLLSVDHPKAVAVDSATGGVVLASTIDPTACLQYADETIADGAASDAELDFSVCEAARNVVLSGSSRIKVLVKVHALLASLPPDVLTVANGKVVVPESGEFPSVVRGPFQTFEVEVDLGKANTMTNISVAANALESEIGRPTGPSNTIVAVYDTQGPKPVIRTRKINSIATSDAYPIISIDFGERVLGANPLDLFSVTWDPPDRGFKRRVQCALFLCGASSALS